MAQAKGTPRIGFECPSLANNGHSKGCAETSALPLKADVAAVGRESPKLTLSCHSSGVVKGQHLMQGHSCRHWHRIELKNLVPFG